MAARAVKHSPRCKFCRSSDLEKANALLERMSTGAMSGDECRAELEKLDIDNPNGGDGWKKHWSPKGHYHYQTEASAKKDAEREEKAEAEREALAEAIFVRVMGPDWKELTPTPEQVLELSRALGVHDLYLKVKSGQQTGITWDHVLKSVGEATKRKQNEATTALLGALAGGISRVFEEQIGGARRGELPRAVPEIVDVEPVDEE